MTWAQRFISLPMSDAFYLIIESARLIDITQDQLFRDIGILSSKLLIAVELQIW